MKLLQDLASRPQPQPRPQLPVALPVEDAVPETSAVVEAPEPPVVVEAPEPPVVVEAPEPPEPEAWMPTAWEPENPTNWVPTSPNLPVFVPHTAVSPPLYDDVFPVEALRQIVTVVPVDFLVHIRQYNVRPEVGWLGVGAGVIEGYPDGEDFMVPPELLPALDELLLWSQASTVTSPLVPCFPGSDDPMTAEEIRDRLGP